MSADLLKVSKGLKLVYWGLMIVVVAGVIGVVGGIFLQGVVAVAQPQDGAAPAFGLFAAFSLLVGVIRFAGIVVGLVGRFFCLSTPPEAGAAKTRITFSVVLEVCSLLFWSVVTAGGLLTKLLPVVAIIVVAGLGSLLQIASVILFLLFAKSLAEFIRRTNLADDADSVLHLVYAVLGCSLLSLVVTIVSLNIGDAGGPVSWVSRIIGLVSLVLTIMALLKGARLLTELSDAVRSFAKKHGRKKRRDEDDPRPRRKRVRDDEEEDEEEDDDRGSRRRRRDDDD